MRLLRVAAVTALIFAFGAGDAGTVQQLSADMAVRIVDSPDPVPARDDLTYTLTVANNGPDPASDVTLSVSLPRTAGQLAVGTSAPASCAGERAGLTCRLGAVRAGSSRTTIVSIKPSDTGAAAATATVASSTPDPRTDNNTATARTTVTSARLRLAIVGSARIPRTPKAGEKFFIIIAVTRTDTGARVDSGRVTCSARIGVRPVRVLLRDPYPSPTCLWRIPYGTRGKLMRGSISVRFAGTSVARRFAFRVR